MSVRSKAYRLYLKSDHWQDLRIKKFSEVGRACQKCGSKSMVHCHHIRYKNYIDVLTSDLAALCEICHDDFHFACKVFKRDYCDIELNEIFSVIDSIRDTEKYRNWKLKIERKSERRAVKPSIRVRPYRNLKKLCRGCHNDNFSPKSINRLIDYAKTLLVNYPTPVEPVKIIQAPKPVVIPTIEDLRKTTTGWTRKVLAEYGIGWPPPKGWRKNLLK